MDITINAMSSKKLLNLYGCAAELDVPAGWLKTAAVDGRVPCLWMGKRILRFNAEAVREAIAELAAKNNRDLRVGDE